MTRRLSHIDNAKAIGMMLIICSHVMATLPLMHSASFKYWCAIINSFYVPLFFLLSGVFEPSSFSWALYKRRMVKLAKFIAIFAIFGLMSAGLIIHNWSIGFCLKGAGTTIWFMFTLFWITAIFGVIKKFKHNWLYIIVLSGGGYFLARTGHSYYYIGQALLCIPTYAIGYYFKDFFKETKFNIKVLLISIVSWIIVLCYFYRSPQSVALNMVNQPYITFYIGAIAGSMTVVELCKLINFAPLEWFGRNSIVPMLVQFDYILLLSKIKIVDNMSLYFTFGLIACILSGLSIPIFRNKRYDIFR